MAGGSKLAVYSAIGGNTVVTIAKASAFAMTGSAAMLSEAIHSFADVSNQCLLAFGIKKSEKTADGQHPYGYARDRYIWTLISAVGIFFIGCGVTVYHGVHTLMEPQAISDYKVAFAVLLFAFIVEGLVLWYAVKAIGKEAKSMDLSLIEYVKAGTDPTGTAVLLEDSAAMLGVVIASIGIGY